MVAKDKKSQGSTLNLVVLPRLGQAGVVKLPQTGLLSLIKELKL